MPPARRVEAHVDGLSSQRENSTGQARGIFQDNRPLVCSCQHEAPPGKPVVSGAFHTPGSVRICAGNHVRALIAG
jgi:hypothetical protein